MTRLTIWSIKLLLAMGLVALLAPPSLTTVHRLVVMATLLLLPGVRR